MVAQHRSAFPGVEAMTLLTDHAFPRHSHDGFGIGIMTAGAQRSWSGIGPVESTAGDVITVNPGEMHDGTPISGARRWRMLYLDPALVAHEVTEAVGDAPEIARPVLRDPVLGKLFERLFTRATAAVPEPLALEEDLLRTLVHIFQRHGARPRPMHPTRPPWRQPGVAWTKPRNGPSRLPSWPRWPGWIASHSSAASRAKPARRPTPTSSSAGCGWHGDCWPRAMFQPRRHCERASRTRAT